jgi:hypothetical protein
MRELAITAVLYLLATTGFAAEHEVEVLGSGAAPVRLSPSTVEGTSSSPGKAGSSRDFQVRFLLDNTSDHTLTLVGVEAVLYAPTGELRGFHDFTFPVHLKPHTRGHYVLYRTGRFKVQGDERIVLMPLLARGRGYRWKASLEALDEVLAGRPDAKQLTPQNPPPPPDPEGGEGGNCGSECSSQQDRCSSKCPCGMSNFTCTCSAGNLSISCSCFQCPVPQG